MERSQGSFHSHMMCQHTGDAGNAGNGENSAGPSGIKG